MEYNIHMEYNIGEGLRRSFATPNPFVLTNNICLNQYNIQQAFIYIDTTIQKGLKWE